MGRIQDTESRGKTSKERLIGEAERGRRAEREMRTTAVQGQCGEDSAGGHAGHKGPGYT